MNTTTLMLAAGAVTGLGVAVTFYGFAPAKPTLAEALASLAAPPPALSRSGRVNAALARPLLARGLPRRKTLHDLAILDRDPAEYVAQQITAGFGAALLLGLLPVLWGAGGQVPLWLAILGGLAGLQFTASRVRAAAAQHRDQMRDTLSAILDLAGGSLAGGAGIDEALHNALEEMSGWAAVRIRRELAAAAQTRGPGRIRTPAALRQLAEDIGVGELSELADAVEHAATGAPAAETMAVLAHTISERITSDLERQANARTAKLAIPIMLYGLGYLIFLLFAALTSIRVGLAG